MGNEGFEGFKALLDVISGRISHHVSYERGLGPIEVGKINKKGQLFSDSMADWIDKDQYLVCDSLLEHDVKRMGESCGCDGHECPCSKCEMCDSPCPGPGCSCPGGEDCSCVDTGYYWPDKEGCLCSLTACGVRAEVRRRLVPGDGYLILFQKNGLPIVVDRLVKGSEIEFE